MEIAINRTDPSEASPSFNVEELARFVLDREGMPETTEVSISFVSESEIQELNERFRGISSPTDVLSFECDTVDDSDWMSCKDEGVFELGDIFICMNVAARNAQEFGCTFVQEVELLVVHGLLHLCGFDHMNDADARIMEAKEEELLCAWRSIERGE